MNVRLGQIDSVSGILKTFDFCKAHIHLPSAQQTGADENFGFVHRVVYGVVGIGILCKSK